MTAEPLYSFEISRNLLRAMALFQSADDTRYILNSTLFEIRKHGSDSFALTLVATDGRRLACHHDYISSDNLLTGLPDNSEFSIDLAGVKKLPRQAGGLVTCSVFAEHAELVSDRFNYKAAFMCPKQGAFPKWRSIIPTTTPTPTLQVAIAGRFIESFSEAASLMSSKSDGIMLTQHGEHGAISVRFCDTRQFYGVLMPLKVEAEHSGQLDWLGHNANREPTESITIHAPGVDTIKIDATGIHTIKE